MRRIWLKLGQLGDDAVSGQFNSRERCSTPTRALSVAGDCECTRHVTRQREETLTLENFIACATAYHANPNP